jgi:hypothetical protein
VTKLDILVESMASICAQARKRAPAWIAMTPAEPIALCAVSGETRRCPYSNDPLHDIVKPRCPRDRTFSHWSPPGEWPVFADTVEKAAKYSL